MSINLVSSLFMKTLTDIWTKTQPYRKPVSLWKVKRLKARLRRIPATYGDAARECKPPVTYDMVFKVVNGLRTSKNVMDAISRLEAKRAKKGAREARERVLKGERK